MEREVVGPSEEPQPAARLTMEGEGSERGFRLRSVYLPCGQPYRVGEKDGRSFPVMIPLALRTLQKALEGEMMGKIVSLKKLREVVQQLKETGD